MFFRKKLKYIVLHKIWIINRCSFYADFLRVPVILKPNECTQYVLCKEMNA